MQKQSSIISRCLGLLSIALLTLISGHQPARANNAAVESALQSSGDLSMFYQALVNTGILNELAPNQHYTIFAPTNASWEEISPRVYPCFYAIQCRPQIAALLRNYIVAGDYSLSDLTTHGSGVPTEGGRVIHVAETYPGDYAVEGKKILTTNESNGSIIYRIDGVIAKPKDLTPFQTVSYEPAAPVAETTVIKKVYMTPTSDTQGNMSAHPTTDGSNDTVTETTVIQHYTVDQ